MARILILQVFNINNDFEVTLEIEILVFKFGAGIGISVFKQNVRVRF